MTDEDNESRTGKDDQARRVEDQARRVEDQARRVEREIRAQRRADLASALAGRDGGGHLKGASPTPVMQRALMEIQQWLAVNLPDNDGMLCQVILRKLALETEQLEAGLGDPAATVGAWLDGILSLPAAIAELVRQADMDWGRLYLERPHFEKPGEPAHPDDPYTIDSVTALLTDLRGRCPA